MTVIYQIPVTVPPDLSLADAAALMDRAGIGSLLVVDDGALLGIVTDRDLALRAVARRVPHDGRIDSVMTTGVLTLPVTAERDEVVRAFQAHTVRRLPLMDGARVVGLVTLDDLLVDATAAELPHLAALVADEVRRPHHEAGLPVRAHPPTPQAPVTHAGRGRGQARVGDQIVIHRHAVGEPDRDGEIVEVHAPAGDPPFRVRWSDTGKVTFFYPGPDAEIRHLVHH
jgi:CBS-domain-containing membrane protein